MIVDVGGKDSSYQEFVDKLPNDDCRFAGAPTAPPPAPPPPPSPTPSGSPTASKLASDAAVVVRSLVPFQLHSRQIKRGSLGGGIYPELAASLSLY